MSAFLKLSRPALVNLATALETGRLYPPYSLSSVANYVPVGLSQDVVGELDRLNSTAMHPKHIAYTLHLLATERSASQQANDRVELVWTGPETVVAESRDTAIVVRELFNNAKKEVLISSYAVRGRELFQVLARRMDANPNLQVRMFLNVQRPYKSEVSDSVLLREFAQTFRQEIWSGQRLPEVFYDVRSLLLDGKTQACLHAKCVVVDQEQLFITSANFTEAAHERNIEAGVVIADSVAAKAIVAQFESLVVQRILLRVPGF